MGCSNDFFCPLGMVGRDIGWSGMVTWLRHNPLWLGYMWGGILLSKPFVASRIIESSLTWMFISVEQHTNGGFNKENDRETTRHSGVLWPAQIPRAGSGAFLGRPQLLARRIKSDWTQGKLFFNNICKPKSDFTQEHYGSHFGSQKGLRIISRAMLRRGKILRCEASFGGRQWSKGHDGSRLPWYGIPTIHSKTKSMKFPPKKNTKNIKDQRHN